MSTGLIGVDLLLQLGLLASGLRVVRSFCVCEWQKVALARGFFSEMPR
ncbi:MAG: hypothetical protein A4E45_01178 [Methanosaeta sp. PtaB.Bin039]|nr:MAG: hypothetical protein A4E45_01178 [Methanosaeta sp. PtaB.Bin039]